MTDRYDGFCVCTTILYRQPSCTSLLSLHFLHIPHLDTIDSDIFFVYVQNHILAFFDIFEDEQFGGDVSPKSDHHSFPTGGHRS